eukprot:CAMPEP_0184249056 /NCGR_PEP_ID=MMETSP0977-20130417/3604_1 /TAXON_ID=483370 /ORGANISM="non described non described, Strain CCMP2097" /LENGTH=77 /DNA_ID=CAMNT_0026554439 /DNA_START=134 /DNA_END=368 /DNA_ORIENTATION=+
MIRSKDAPQGAAWMPTRAADEMDSNVTERPRLWRDRHEDEVNRLSRGGAAALEALEDAPAFAEVDAAKSRCDEGRWE